MKRTFLIYVSVFIFFSVTMLPVHKIMWQSPDTSSTEWDNTTYHVPVRFNYISEPEFDRPPMAPMQKNTGKVGGLYEQYDEERGYAAIWLAAGKPRTRLDVLELCSHEIMHLQLPYYNADGRNDLSETRVEHYIIQQRMRGWTPTDAPATCWKHLSVDKNVRMLPGIYWKVMAPFVFVL